MKPAPAMLAALFLTLLVPFPAPAAEWPQWRGPSGDGSSPEKDLPVEWSKTKNVAWRLALPGAAGSTPVTSGGKVFLTTVDGSDILLLAIGADGKEVWRRKLGTGNKNVRGDEGNSASASPSTDGKHVWAMAGTGDFACYDLAGTEVWKTNLQERHGKYKLQFVMASTPLLHEESLYVQCIHSGEPYLLALDKMTGKDRWKQVRKTDARDECEHAYTSPILYQDKSRTLILVHGADWCTAHSPSDGSEQWRCGALNPRDHYNNTLRFVASPACADGLVVIPSAKGGPVMCVRPDGKGDITQSGRIWSRERDTPDVPTPAIHDGLVYLLRETGVLICTEASTGKELYQQRGHADRHRASPVVADGKVYCASVDGTVTVVQAGREHKILASNAMEEHIASTPVVANGRIYLRTYDALYAIELPKAPEKAASGD